MWELRGRPVNDPNQPALPLGNTSPKMSAHQYPPPSGVPAIPTTGGRDPPPAGVAGAESAPAVADGVRRVMATMATLRRRTAALALTSRPRSSRWPIAAAPQRSTEPFGRRSQTLTLATIQSRG